MITSMFVDKSAVYMYFAVLTAIAFLVLVPKQQYKHFLLYGMIFGGMGDTLIAAVLSWLHLIKYTNMGYFNMLNLISSWTPISWMFSFALFLYLLPVKRIFVILHILGWSAFTYGVSLVFQNFGIYEYGGTWIYFAPFLFIVWLSITAWFYRRDNKNYTLE